MDIVTRVKKLPLPGETTKGLGTKYNPGGKGANQAVAASLAGGFVKMIGAVGEEALANELVTSLEQSGIDTTGIKRKQCTSGMAFITVDDTGQNSIILSGGANARLTNDDINESLPTFSETGILLLQNEIPWPTIKYAMEMARENGLKVIYNPAPVTETEGLDFQLIDVAVVNEIEIEAMTGISVENVIEAEQAAQKLLDFGVHAVLLTMGKEGSFYLNQDGKSFRVPAVQVNAVDTTAAGDTFIGAFAVKYYEGASLEKAIEFASAAAAISVTRHGAQVSIPKLEEIKEMMGS